MPRHDATVQLSGGNAIAVPGAVIKELRRDGASQSGIDAFKSEAMSGSYDPYSRPRWVGSARSNILFF